MKTKEKILAVPLTFLFLLASTLCCCLPLSSHAEAATVSNHSTNHTEKNCHSSTASETDQSSHADCHCGHDQLIAVSSQLNLDLPVNLLSQWQVLKDVLVFSSYQNLQLSLALYPIHSPPGLLSQSIPLFIKNSVLRI